MRTTGATGVRRFSVELEVANYGDLSQMYCGVLAPEQVRRETVQAVVDSGAMKRVLPQALVKRLERFARALRALL
jgi:hypothetical protein